MSYSEIPGWAAFAVDVYDDFLTNHAKSGDKVVEVGVMFGKSLAYLCEGAKARGIALEVHAIDSWKDNGHWLPVEHPFREIAKDLGGPYAAFCALMFRHSPETLESAHVHRMSSLEGRKLIVDGSCALVLLDGDHSYEGCTADIEAWRSAVKPGGMLAGDDYDPANFPGVVRAVKTVFGDDFTVRGTSWIAGKRGVPVPKLADQPAAWAAAHAPVATQTEAQRVSVPAAPGPQMRLLPGFALDTAWVVVETIGGARLVGKRASERDGVIDLSPAFELPPLKLFFPMPQPGNDSMGVGELALSNAPWSSMGSKQRAMTVRWASMERLADLPQEQQQQWVHALKTLMDSLP